MYNHNVQIFSVTVSKVVHTVGSIPHIERYIRNWKLMIPLRLVFGIPCVQTTASCCSSISVPTHSSLLPTTHKPCTTTRTHHCPRDPLSPADAPNFCGFRYYGYRRPRCQIPYTYRLVGRPAGVFHMNSGLYSRCERGHTLKQQVGRQVIWPRSGPSLYVPPDVPRRFHLLCWTTSRREGRASCRQSLKEVARWKWKGRSRHAHSPMGGGKSHLPISAPAQRPYTHGMTGKCRLKGLFLRVEYVDRSAFR